MPIRTISDSFKRTGRKEFHLKHLGIGMFYETLLFFPKIVQG